MKTNSRFYGSCILFIALLATLIGCENRPATNNVHLDKKDESILNDLSRSHLLLDISALTSGDRYSCTLNNAKIYCWGETGYFEHDYGPEVLLPPPLINPTLFVSSDYTNCALHDAGLQCWGRYGSILNETAPSLANIKQLSLGRSHACALHGNTVTCWGDNTFSQLNTPTLSDPSQISSLGNNNCVIDNNNIVCWGSSIEVSQVPAMVNPKQVTVGWGFACALHDGGVKCWGDNVFSEVFLA